MELQEGKESFDLCSLGRRKGKAGVMESGAMEYWKFREAFQHSLYVIGIGNGIYVVHTWVEIQRSYLYIQSKINLHSSELSTIKFGMKWNTPAYVFMFFIFCILHRRKELCSDRFTQPHLYTQNQRGTPITGKRQPCILYTQRHTHVFYLPVVMQISTHMSNT